MGYTFAIQVTAGRELEAKAKLLDLIQRVGNPGIIAIHALETFEQTISNKGISYRKWKAKVTGYIFVTLERCNGLHMDADCWQLIRLVPHVRKILNYYIEKNEWNKFFKEVGDIEPEIQVVETQKAICPHAEADETIEEEVVEVNIENKRMFFIPIKTVMSKITHKYMKMRTIAKIPLSLYKYLIEKNKDSPDTIYANKVITTLKGVGKWKNQFV